MTKEKLAALAAAAVLAVGVGGPAAFAQEATLYSGATPAAVQHQSSSASQQAESAGAQDTDNVQQGDQTGADNEKAGAENENQSEKAGDSANDPQEAPGTPGYQEGNFQGEF